MREQHRDEDRNSDEESPVEVLLRIEGIAPLRDGDEWNVRSFLGKRGPLFCQLALALHVYRKCAEDRQRQKRSEQDDRRDVARGAQVEGRPDRHAPEKGMTRDTQDATHSSVSRDGGTLTNRWRVRHHQSWDADQKRNEQDWDGKIVDTVPQI